MEPFEELYERDRGVWNRCAVTYEKRIVGGHPDITAFEAFEEDFLDRVLRHVAGADPRRIKLLDLGCGSGRLHVRYGAKTVNVEMQPGLQALARMKEGRGQLLYDPLLAQKLQTVWGIDFSSSMIRITLPPAMMAA